MPTAADIHRLTTGQVIDLGAEGPCRFVRVRNRRAIFVTKHGERVNLYLSALSDDTPLSAAAPGARPSTPPASPAGVTDDDKEVHHGASEGVSGSRGVS